MKTRKNRVMIAAAVSAMAVLMASCSGGGESAEGEKGGEMTGDQTVTWYTDYDPEESAALIQAFEDETGIRVEQYAGASAANLTDRLLSEHVAGRTEADVATFSGVDKLETLTEAGAFAPLPDSVVDQIADMDPEFKDADNNWFALSAILIAIAYNTDLVDEKDAPSEYEDFLDPAWADSFNIPVSTNSTSITSYHMMAHAPHLGRDFLTGLGSNGGVSMSKSGDQAANIIRGEQKGGFFNDYVAWKRIDDGAPLAVVYPENGVSHLHDYTALTADAPNPEAAEAWLRFLATKEAAEIFQESTLRMSTFPGVTPYPDSRPAISDLNLFPDPDSEAILAEQDELGEFLRDAFGE